MSEDAKSYVREVVPSNRHLGRQYNEALIRRFGPTVLTAMIAKAQSLSIARYGINIASYFNENGSLEGLPDFSLQGGAIGSGAMQWLEIVLKKGHAAAEEWLKQEACKGPQVFCGYPEVPDLEERSD